MRPYVDLLWPLVLTYNLRRKLPTRIRYAVVVFKTRRSYTESTDMKGLTSRSMTAAASSLLIGFF